MRIDGVVTLALAAAMLVACSPSSGPTGDEPAVRAPATDATPSRDEVASPAAAASGGREIEPEALPLIQGGAKIAASVVACGLGTRAQAEEGFESQRAGYVEQGYSAASYDRAIDAAFREVDDKFAQASAAEKAQACESVKRLGDQFNQMGEEMLRRQDSTP